MGVAWLGASVGWEGETRGAFIYAGVPGWELLPTGCSVLGISSAVAGLG